MAREGNELLSGALCYEKFSYTQISTRNLLPFLLLERKGILVTSLSRLQYLVLLGPEPLFLRLETSLSLRILTIDDGQGQVQKEECSDED